ncbi:serine/threonine-protein kinase nekl-3 [Anaeramoeba flamelloides]|uniref:Serine/threonine-protein kinase nekl-3 n=1 Tax=Anaeramoeba flamelloides TaxID=1746091 RepID=A0ABQ8X3R8_9EUKA|nr:serine/threonine-protein kinase nekl-3 [Anaeramoeba flamelloides]
MKIISFFVFLIFFCLTTQSYEPNFQRTNSSPFTKTSYSVNRNTTTLEISYPLDTNGFRIREDESITGRNHQNNYFVDSSPVYNFIPTTVVSNVESLDRQDQIKSEIDPFTNILKITKPNKKSLLIYDPLVYSSYFTGSGTDKVSTFSIGIGADSYTIILAGTTNSKNFPLQNPLSNVAIPDNNDHFAFITRYDSNGNIIFSTYFGGTLGESQKGSLIIQPTFTERNIDGEFWICGTTTTTDIPLTQNGFQNELFHISKVGFILCLNNMGNSILYSSLLGEEDNSNTYLNSIRSMTTQSDSYILVGGSTNSNSKQILKNSLQEVFSNKNKSSLYFAAFRLFANRTDMIIGSIFGGNNDDTIENIVAFPENNGITFFLTGNTNSSDFFDLYNKIQSPDAIFIDDKLNVTSPTGFFLNVFIEPNDNLTIYTPRLISGSYLGGKYEDRAWWVQTNVFEQVQNEEYYGTIWLSGYTKNYDTFQGDPIRPDWMKNTANNGESTAGFLVNLNHKGTEILFSMLFGCPNKTTSLNFNYPHPINSIFVSGYTNCKESELPLKNSIWDEISPNNNNMTDFEYKYYMMNLNLTKYQLYGKNVTYQDMIYYSSFVDGVDNVDKNLEYAAVKTDLVGNIYSIFNVEKLPYLNSNFSKNAFMIEPEGNSSIMIRVYGDFPCNPGSYASDFGLCISCPQGKKFVLILFLFCFVSTISLESNAKECILCPSGTYQPDFGQIECYECPDNKTSHKGQTSCFHNNVPTQPIIYTTNITHCSITLKWEKLDDPLDFQVSLDRNTGMEIQTVVIVPNEVYVNSTFSWNSVIINGLTPASRYYFRMRSIFNTNWQFGAWSSSVVASTIAPPNRIHSSEIEWFSQPRNITLKWPEANDPSGEQDQYHIEYQEIRDDNKFQQEKISKVNSIVLHNLHPNTEYSVTIVPENSAGLGFASAPINISTIPTIPGVVQPTAKQTDVELELSWLPPLDNGGLYISSYLYTCIQLDDQLTVVYNGTTANTKMNFKNLDPDTKYNITINAYNGVGYSPDNYITYTTKEQIKNNSLKDTILGVTFGGVGLIFLIVTIILFLTRNRIIKARRRRDIRKLRFQYKKRFTEKIQKDFYNLNDTLYFDNINEKTITNYFIEQFNHRHYVKKQKVNWFFLNKDLKNGIAFGKLANMLEIEIHQKIWKQYSLNPQGTPIVQFYCSIPLTKKYLQKHNLDMNDKKNRKRKKKRKLINARQSQNTSDTSFTETETEEFSTGMSEQDDFGFSSGFESKKESESDISVFNSSVNEQNKQLINKQLMDKRNKNKGQKMILILEYTPFTLDHLINKRKQKKMIFTDNEKIWLAYTLFHSLKFIHDNSFIHRDIKPQNIVIGLDGYPRLTDFGCAIELKEETTQIYDRYVGTRFYFDPDLKPDLDNEDAENQYLYTFAHDVYALGKTLEKLLSIEIEKNKSELNTIFKRVIKRAKAKLNKRYSVDEIINFLQPHFDIID